MQQRIITRVIIHTLLLIALILPTFVFAKSKPEQNGATDLIRAIRDGEQKKAGKLIELKTDINAADDFGWTPLMYAVFREDIELVEKLIAGGAEINKADQDGVTPLIASILRAPEPFMIQYLPERSKNPVLIAHTLIERGADPNLADKEGNSPLIYATVRIQESVVAALIRKGANPDQADRYGRTALFFMNNPDQAGVWAPSDCKLASYLRARRIASDESRWKRDYAAKVAESRAQANITVQEIKARIAKLLSMVGAAAPDPKAVQAPVSLIDSLPVKIRGMENLSLISMNFMRNESKYGSYPYAILVCVAKDGTARKSVVLSGYPYGASEQLQKAAMKLKYKPAMKNGEPVEFWDRIGGVGVSYGRSLSGLARPF